MHVQLDFDLDHGHDHDMNNNTIRHVANSSVAHILITKWLPFSQLGHA